MHTILLYLVDVGPAEVLVVWQEFQDPALIAKPQSSTNQSALSLGSPAQPSYCDDKVRFV